MSVEHEAAGRDGALTLPRLADISGVEYRTLHTWLKRGLVHPSIHAAQGTGSTNLFASTDAVIARVLGDLRRAGLSMQSLERSASALQDAGSEIVPGAVLVVNGSVKIFPSIAAAAAALNRSGVSLVYRFADAIEAVRRALSSQ